jgi:hypothetical protein
VPEHVGQRDNDDIVGLYLHDGSNYLYSGYNHNALHYHLGSSDDHASANHLPSVKPPGAGPVLEGGGLGVVQFGVTEAQLTKALTAQYGPAASVEEAPPSHCENGAYTRSIRWGALSAYIKDGRFVAYRVTGDGAAGSPAATELRTAKGSRCRATIEEVRATYGPNLPQEPSIGVGTASRLRTVPSGTTTAT